MPFVKYRLDWAARWHSVRIVLSLVSSYLHIHEIAVPNILVAWYYHRAIINSTSDPPYPMLTQQLPPFLHQKNISAANTLEKISIQFDLGPLTGFVMAHIRKVSLLVNTWIFRSIIGDRCNKDVQLQMGPGADFAWGLLMEQNRFNSSHKDLIQAINLSSMFRRDLEPTNILRHETFYVIR